MKLTIMRAVLTFVNLTRQPETAAIFGLSVTKLNITSFRKTTKLPNQVAIDLMDEFSKFKKSPLIGRREV